MVSHRMATAQRKTARPSMCMYCRPRDSRSGVGGSRLPQAGRLELEGGVIVEQSGATLVAEGVIRSPDDSATQRLLGSSAILTCDRLVISTEERTARAEGNLSVKQEGRAASAAAATYADRERRLTMTGSVVLLDKDGSRLRADMVVISLADETVEATGNVVTEFILGRK